MQPRWIILSVKINAILVWLIWNHHLDIYHGIMQTCHNLGSTVFSCSECPIPTSLPILATHLLVWSTRLVLVTSKPSPSMFLLNQNTKRQGQIFNLHSFTGNTYYKGHVNHWQLLDTKQHFQMFFFEIWLCKYLRKCLKVKKKKPNI